jgi:molybdate transport system substrate-binding protein
VRGSRPAAVLLAIGAALAALAGCGGGAAKDDGTQGGGERERGGALVVSAASSLTAAFTAYGAAFARDGVRLSFAGSDDLAAQIRQGVKPDVFAAANTSLPAALHAEGLVARPIAFAQNRLVIAVPAHHARVRSLADLVRPGTTIAIGSESVPIGAYARELIGRLGHARASAILANVRSSEPDVKGIVGKLAQGAVDAGFVYVTDVRAASGRLSAIALPPRLQPQVVYAAAVVRGARHPQAARRFVAGLLHGAGAEELRAAGFEPPPAG